MEAKGKQPARIEIKTLVQELAVSTDASDKILADLLNEGWEIQSINVHGYSVPFEYTSFDVVTRVVTLSRLVEDDGGDEEPAQRDVLGRAVRTTGPGAVEAALIAAEPPVDELDTRELIAEATPSLSEALLSGAYTPAELRSIAQWEAVSAGLGKRLAFGPVRLLGGREIDTLVCRLG